MKTTVTISIKSEEDAINFLTELYDNDETYHPEDDAHQTSWNTCNPTSEEKDNLNRIMKEIYNLDIDPCDILMQLFQEENRYFDTRE